MYFTSTISSFSTQATSQQGHLTYGAGSLSFHPDFEGNLGQDGGRGNHS